MTQKKLFETKSKIFTNQTVDAVQSAKISV